MAKRPKGRTARARPAKQPTRKKNLAKNYLPVTETAGTPNPEKNIDHIHEVYWALFFLCFSVYFYLSALASTQGLDVQSMLSLQWDGTLEQWASKISPKLASPHLSMAFFMFQDVAFVCALAWSVFLTLLFHPCFG